MKLTTISCMIFTLALSGQLYAPPEETAQPQVLRIGVVTILSFTSIIPEEVKQLAEDITRGQKTIKYNRYLIDLAESNDLKSLETSLDNLEFNKFISFAAILKMLQMASKTKNAALAETIFDH